MNFRFFFFIISFLLINLQVVTSQVELAPSELIEIPKFYMDALSFQSSEAGVSRLDVFVEVPYEAMQFTKYSDNFRSEYEVAINIYDTTETLVAEKWWTEKVEVPDYNQTTSKTTSNLNQRSFLVTPGLYFVTVQVKDHESDRGTRIKKKVSVKRYTDVDFGISDIMIANRIEYDSGKTSIFPNISGNVGGVRDSFQIFFEIYNSIGIDSSKLFVQIFNMKGDTVRVDSFSIQLGTKKRHCFQNIHTSELIPGDYILQTYLNLPQNIADESKKEVSSTSSRSFVVRWRGMPVSITDLNLAIDQLEYVADRESIDEMRKAPMEKKKTLFQEFWNKKDPSPNSDRNELMEEYYSRVAYANKHFGHYIDGWKTDMGMVYCIFGSPSNIERHPFDIDSKPYEVWTYYEISREFIFVDVTGFGEYRLQNPLWDLRRTRPRR
ncbi:MAG: GWxTD domain-containing protein [Ignavibacteriales bacterium]|nr:GWxTD domain-containing protein [Ignavibacteriales bacterium]